MENKPWTKIDVARRFCAWEGESYEPPQPEAEVLETCNESPVLTVYVTVHALNRQADLVTALFEVGIRHERFNELASSMRDNHQLQRMQAQAWDQHKRCPAAFQGLLITRLNYCTYNLFTSQHTSLGDRGLVMLTLI